MGESAVAAGLPASGCAASLRAGDDPIGMDRFVGNGFMPPGFKMPF